jgi:hypothetical protein
MIVDLLPALTRLFFLGRLPADVQLSRLQVSLLISRRASAVCCSRLAAAADALDCVQSSILLGLGAQCLTAEELAKRLDVDMNQLLSYFNKSIRKIANALRAIQVRSWIVCSFWLWVWWSALLLLL